MESSGSQRHFFDLKSPLGSLLGFYGILLVLYGIFSARETYDKSLHININLIWGALIMVVGIVFLLVAYLEKSK